MKYTRNNSFLLIGSLSIFILMFACEAMAASSVSRSFSTATPQVCSNLTVNLAVTVQGNSYYAIDETLPTGWSVLSATGGADYITLPGHIYWLVLMGATSTSYQYTVSVPCNAFGTYLFSGTYAFDLNPTSNIAGSTSINIGGPATITIVPMPAQTGTVGTSYSYQVIATGGQAALSYSLTGVTPPGLSINPTSGLISGTPTTAGSYNYNVAVTDGISPTTSPIAMTVNPSATITIVPIPAQTGTVGTSYSYQVIATGGQAALSYSLTGVTPPGLAINPTSGLISGTPTTAGSYNYNVAVTDGISPKSSPIAMTVNPSACTDADLDTYATQGGSCGLVDCNDNNAAIHPGASDANCNGIDDNCNGQIDEAYAPLPTSCGVGACASTGTTMCMAGGMLMNTCVSGTPTPEVCDGIDNNCNGQIDEGVQLTFYQDMDSDMYGNLTSIAMACVPPQGYVVDSTDCQDGYSSVNPGAIEICDSLDNNCNGHVDEGVQLIFYRDFDMDTFGNLSYTAMACTAPPGFVPDNTDCDDNDIAINPAAIEVCDLIDNNCNGQIDEGVQSTFYMDYDSDSFGNSTIAVMACTAPLGYVIDNTDCEDNDFSINPAAQEVCDLVDQNCNGLVDEGVQLTFYHDMDSDMYGNLTSSIMACTAPVGYVSDSTDCNDADMAINPAALEICDLIDNNCNGQVDEGVQLTFYHDMDSDMYGNLTSFIMACTAPIGYVSDSTDCNDADMAINPAALEICDLIDNNCNGQVDEGVQLTFYLDSDADTFGNASFTTMACTAPLGYVADNTDCEDANPGINPSMREICDLVDQNCNGIADEGVQTAYHLDSDLDQYGNPMVTMMACTLPIGYVYDNSDCNDNDSNIHPHAFDLPADGIDQNCDSMDDAVMLASSPDVQTASPGDVITFYAPYYGHQRTLTILPNTPCLNLSQAMKVLDANVTYYQWTVPDCGGSYTASVGGILNNLVFRVFASPPSLKIYSSNPNSSLAKAGDIIFFNITGLPMRDITGISLEGKSALIKAEGNNSISEYTVTSSDPDGMVEFSIRFVDADGFIGEMDSHTTKSKIVIDNTLQSPILSAPQHNSFVRSSMTNFQWYALGEPGYSDLYIDGNLVHPSISSNPWTSTSYVASGIAQGMHTWQIVSRDMAGNSMSSSVFTFSLSTTGQNCTDADNDGHLCSSCGGDDPDDNSSNVYPGAIELNDGIDNDCDGIVDEGFARCVRGTGMWFNFSCAPGTICKQDPYGCEDSGNNTCVRYGNLTAVMTHNGSDVLEFEWDAENSYLDMSLMNCTEDYYTDRGSMLLQGFEHFRNKTVYLKKIANTGKVCIKNATLWSITEVSSGCSASDETLLMCDGRSYNGYSCTIMGSKYKVTGLQHSAVVEFISPAQTPSSGSTSSGSGGSGGSGGSSWINPYCGDGKCSASETCSTCAKDCGECAPEAPIIMPTEKTEPPPETVSSEQPSTQEERAMPPDEQLSNDTVASGGFLNYIIAIFIATTIAVAVFLLREHKIKGNRRLR